MSVHTAFAKPSFSLLSVTALAWDFTSAQNAAEPTEAAEAGADFEGATDPGVADDFAPPQALSSTASATDDT